MILMKNRSILYLFVVICCQPGTPAIAGSHDSGIVAWQRHYKAEFLTDPRSPVKGSDIAYIRFFKPDKRWAVKAEIIRTPAAQPFDMATHSGKTKRFRQYATLRFTAPGPRGLRHLTLSAYERIDPPAGDTESAKTLFIPFQDLTNGEETYGGGRYMDLMRAEMEGNHLLLDFNKAYNPYCAFAEGFSCPIPPAENRLAIRVAAGEQLPAPPLRPKE